MPQAQKRMQNIGRREACRREFNSEIFVNGIESADTEAKPNEFVYQFPFLCPLLRMHDLAVVKVVWVYEWLS